MELGEIDSNFKWMIQRVKFILWYWFSDLIALEAWYMYM
jgi:hypothetical protein